MENFSTLETIRISDIQTSQLIYFDVEFKEHSYTFCQKRNIDCLPSMDNPHVFFLRDDESRDFREEVVESPRIVNGLMNIFASEMLDRFRANHLLFVHEHGELSGVVHFSDYNKPVVSTYLYKSFLIYEKTLRNLLIESKLKNEHMHQYFQFKETSSENAKERKHYKSKRAEYEKKKEDFSDLPIFQPFYLADLIGLAVHQKIIGMKVETIETIRGLRNSVMHAHEFVSKEDFLTDDFIYKFDAFETFFEASSILQLELKRLMNRVAFLSGDDVLAGTVGS